MKSALCFVAVVALAGCGGDNTAAEDNVADQLDAAAEQSAPEAAAVLENEADAIEAGNAPATDAQVQESLQNAGEAQTRNSE